MKYIVFTIENKVSVYYTGKFDSKEEAITQTFQLIQEELKEVKRVDIEETESGRDIMQIKIQLLESDNGLIVWYTRPDSEKEIPIYIVEET